MTESSPPEAETPKTAKSKRKRQPFGRLLLLIMRLMLVPPVVAAVLIYMPGPLMEEKSIVVPHGSHVYDIASMLDSNGVTLDPVLFRIASKFLANDAMKAGEYQFPPHVSIAGAVMQLHNGRSVVRLFTVSEGLTSAEIVALLNDVPLSGTVATPPDEGTLLPESYRYNSGDSREGLITRMQKAMQEALNSKWSARDTTVPVTTPQEALIMASIVEKETGKPEERARIAQVFYNRLQHSMRLQSDPTVIYALTKGKGPLERALTRDDLALVSPYSTYTSDGLPPRPICNPGRASIDAVLHPEANDFLYFVADGTGGHVFSKDLTAHNQNVTKWNAVKSAPPVPAVKPVAR